MNRARQGLVGNGVCQGYVQVNQAPNSVREINAWLKRYNVHNMFKVRTATMNNGVKYLAIQEYQRRTGKFETTARCGSYMEVIDLLSRYVPVDWQYA
jgi:hypothetical protein